MIMPANIEKPLHILAVYAARALMLSLFLPKKVQVWVVGCASVYLVLYTLLTGKAGPGKNYKWALILSVPYLLYLVSIPFTAQEYIPGLLATCEQKVSLLLMPFMFAVIFPHCVRLLWDEMIFFVYGSLIIAAAGNAAFAYNYFFAGGTANGLSHVAYRTFMHNFTLIHPTYLSMYLSLSICILLLKDVLVQKYAVIKNSILYLLLIFLLALGAKAPILATLVILIHYAWTHRYHLRQYRMLFVGLVFTVVAAWLFIPFFSQRMGELIGLFSNAQPGKVADNSVYVRKLIWNTDVELLKQYWLTGTGPGRLTPVLQQHYAPLAASGQLPVAYYDPHNEYMYEWLAFGLAGIIAFGGILLLHFTRALRSRDHLYYYLLMIFAITFFTESVLSVQRGVVFFAIFTSMMFFARMKPAMQE